MGRIGIYFTKGVLVDYLSEAITIESLSSGGKVEISKKIKNTVKKIEQKSVLKDIFGSQTEFDLSTFITFIQFLYRNNYVNLFYVEQEKKESNLSRNNLSILIKSQSKHLVGTTAY
jgi:hypothetical protein